MASKTLWTCDGCDAEVVSVSGDLPPGWETSALRLDRKGVAPLLVDSDLCRRCTERLVDQCIPRHWPRTPKAVADNVTRLRADG